MQIIVCVKPVPDLAQLSVSAGQQKIFERGKRILSSGDLSAVEAALRWKTVLGGPVTALTAGRQEDIDVLRKPLAMGVEAAAAVVDPSFENPLLASVNIHHALARAIHALAPEGALVCCGAGGRPENGCGTTGPALAELLNLSCAVHVISGDPAPDGKSMRGGERLSGHDRTFTLELPGVCIIHPAGFPPRAASAMNIMKAVKKPVHSFELNTLAPLPPVVKSGGPIRDGAEAGSSVVEIVGSRVNPG